MTTMNCIVIEDDKVQQKIIINLISRVDSLLLVGVYGDSESASKEISKMNVELIFLDVEMPGMTGIEFLEQIELPESTKVIMTTSNKKYALDAYENDVIDYLLKPISFSRFSKSMSKLLKPKTSSIDNNFLFVRANGASVKLFFDDILWIKSASEYIVIYTTKGKHMVYSTMSSILEKLPEQFLRVHRSHIVSVNKIEKILPKHIEIGGQIIRIGKSYAAELEKIYK